jgi:CRP-like cAMP-binding protein
VASIAQEVEFRKGEVIFSNNDPGDAIYFIMRGAVRLHRDDVDIFIVADQESFGEMEVLSNEPRFMMATALEDVAALKISGEEFFDMLADNISIAQDILKLLVGRIKVLMENSRLSLVFWLKDD